MAISREQVLAAARSAAQQAHPPPPSRVQQLSLVGMKLLRMAQASAIALGVAVLDGWFNLGATEFLSQALIVLFLVFALAEECLGSRIPLYIGIHLIITVLMVTIHRAYLSEPQLCQSALFFIGFAYPWQYLTNLTVQTVYPSLAVAFVAINLWRIWPL